MGFILFPLRVLILFQKVEGSILWFIEEVKFFHAWFLLVFVMNLASALAFLS